MPDLLVYCFTASCSLAVRQDLLNLGTTLESTFVSAFHNIFIYTITSIKLQATGLSANCYLKIPGCNPLVETFNTQCQSPSSLLFCPSARMARCPFSGCNNKLAKEQQAFRNWLKRKQSMLQPCPLIAVSTLTALPFCELTLVLGF